MSDGRPGSQSCSTQTEPAAGGRPVFSEAGRKKMNCLVAVHVEAEEGFIEGQYGQYLMSDVIGAF